MPRLPFRLADLTAAALACFLLAPVPARAAWPTDPYSGNVRLSNIASNQIYPRMVADGSGGAFIAWHDNRSGNYDIYIQRVGSTGSVMWAAAAVPVCTAANDQANTALVSDGAGGVIVTWHDYRAGNWDVYAQRFNAAGVAQWAANGVAICTATNPQTDPQICTDGAGGAILTWSDLRAGIGDVYAQRIDAGGTVKWAANGVGVCTIAGDQGFPVIAVDGQGGAIIAWRDQRVDASDVYAQRLGPSGAAQWAANGVAVSAAASGQSSPQIISDGYTGAILCWEDSRSGSADIYADRISSAGTTLWGTTNGTLVCSAAGTQTSANLCSDGASGAVISWLDTRSGGVGLSVYVQRMSGGGSPLWTSSGVAIRIDNVAGYPPPIVSDGAGGAMIGWALLPSIYSDLYAQRVTSSGGMAWAAGGTLVSGAFNNQQFPNGVSDGNGGMIIAWHDYRSSPVSALVYAQRVDRYAQLGSAEPTLTSVRDTPNDQGGQVKVAWNRSYLDDAPNYTVTQYRVWRSAPAALFEASRAARRTTSDPDVAAANGDLLVLAGASAYAWELVATQTAAGLPSYSAVVPTTGDSVASSNPTTAFMVEARVDASAASARWFSAPDSGYSVDNLAPPALGSFTGSYLAGVSDLHWAASTAADFAAYRLYRGASADFTPSNGSLIATLANPSYVDAAPKAYTYKVAAVDVHGNEGPYATLTFPGVTGAPAEGPPRAFALADPQPNPALTGTRIAYELPAAAAVKLSVLDVSGRVLCVLEQGGMPAGRRELRWDLRDATGAPVPAGIYFVRLEAGRVSLTRRIVAMR